MSSEAALPFPQALVEPGLPPATEVAASGALSGALGETVSVFSDEELLQALAKGEKQALSTLFKRHGRSVYHVAWRILRSEAEADDLRQDVFVYLYEHAHQFQAQKGSASSWIIQVTYHRAFDRRRFLRHRQGPAVEIFDEEQYGARSAQPSTDQIDGQAILNKLRDQLTLEQQRTLHMHFFEGYSFREIAARSGQTVGNVRHHYYRALERLRANLFSKKRG